MMHVKDTLGIVVNSNRYFDFVVNLAEAAAEHDKVVHIHLLGAGCEFIITDGCMRLSRWVQITMCSKSAQQIVQEEAERVKDRICMVPPQELTRLLKQCDRYVVF